jgi:dTDP-4-dehydrorhamnose 3,5-epimerase
MIFNETNLPGVYVIEPEPRYDERGFFARLYCEDEFTAHGIKTDLVQCSMSFNPLRGTFRGMHYQAEPYAEVRTVRCTRGAIYDVVLDLRKSSPTYCQWTGCELTGENRLTMVVPQGCAHGLLTLTDDTEVFYQMSEYYKPEAVCGVRWNDPAFRIVLPFAPVLISERDAHYSDYVR